MVSIGMAINNLRFIKGLQTDMIDRLEDYERAVVGGEPDRADRTGYCNGYISELGYLKQRRSMLDAAIRSVENYVKSSQDIGALAAG